MKLSDLDRHELIREGATMRDVESALFPEDKFAAPWIARLLLGVGGWLTALFVSGFTGLLLFETIGSNEQGLALGVGIVYLAVSVLLSRISDHPFLSQLTLAVGTAGFALVTFGMWEAFGKRDGFYSLWALMVLCPAVYWFSKNDTQRFSSVFVIFLVWFLYKADYRSGQEYAVPLTVALCGTLILGSGMVRTSAWRPALFGMVSGLLLLLYVVLAQQTGARQVEPVIDSVWIAGMIAAGFPVVLGILTKPLDPRRVILMVVLGAALMAIGWFGGGGIAACVGLLLVGRARNDRALIWIAIIGLAVFIIAFYYFLGESLLTKSCLMMGTGIGLLLVPVFARILFNQTKPAVT